MGLLGAVVFLPPFLQVLLIPFRGLPDSSEITITTGLIVFTFIINTILFIVLPLIYLRMIYSQRPRLVWQELRMGFTSRTPVHMLIGAGATLAGFFAFAFALELLVLLKWIPEPEPSPLVIGYGKILTWWIVLLLPVMAALTEEIFFRAVLQPRIGLWASSALFGLVHIDYGTWLQLVAPFLLGLLFGYMYLKTKSLWAPIAGHFFFDAFNLTLLKLEGVAASIGFLWWGG
jgi:uncharacterized protein